MTENIAVIFDMDGVITDNMNTHKKAWRLFCKKYNINISEEDFLKYFGRTNKELLSYLFKREISDLEENILGEEKEKIYREIYKKDLKPIKGLLPFLEELKSHQVFLAVASSAPLSNMGFVIDGLGIREYFNTILNASDVSVSKPDPEIYLKAAQKTGVEPGNCVVVEDSPPGILAAKRAGMKVIAITTSHPSEKFENVGMIIKNFTELNYKTIVKLLE